MEEIRLNIQEFKVFNDDDQFGFFYSEDGYPTEDASEKFDENVSALYNKYDYISIDSKDNIFGVKNGKKDLLMKEAFDAYEIAEEVKEG